MYIEQVPSIYTLHIDIYFKLLMLFCQKIS